MSLQTIAAFLQQTTALREQVGSAWANIMFCALLMKRC